MIKIIFYRNGITLKKRAQFASMCFFSNSNVPIFFSLSWRRGGVADSGDPANFTAHFAPAAGLPMPPGRCSRYPFLNIKAHFICKCKCKCIRNWPLPIGAFQDQCKQIVINKHNLVKNPNFLNFYYLRVGSFGKKWMHLWLNDLL